MNILKKIYHGFAYREDNVEDSGSSDMAMSRLKSVVSQDRLGINSSAVTRINDALEDVLSTYVETRGRVKVEFVADGRDSLMTSEVVVKKVKVS